MDYRNFTCTSFCMHNQHLSSLLHKYGITNDYCLQEMINASRKLINAQIVLATSNLLETVKTKVVRISKRFTK
jgi:hypothetical protein